MSDQPKTNESNTGCSWYMKLIICIVVGVVIAQIPSQILLSTNANIDLVVAIGLGTVIVSGILTWILLSKMNSKSSLQRTKLIQNLRFSSPVVSTLKTQIDELVQKSPQLEMVEIMANKSTFVGGDPSSALQPLKILREKLAKAQEEEEQVRVQAARELGELSNSNALNALITALGDDYTSVRAASAEALGKIGNINAIQSLQKISQNDPDESVRKVAEEAIAKINQAKQ